ncbi:MAG TPA: heme-copper oxidase subunit III [Flavisolibacter sp.]|nr:heme-copper oxidase subunit III [Flavisolibacter sp.]
MVSVSTQQRNKTHPHKFAMWVAIGSIVMMFAGLTSAYIVKSGSAGWHEVKTPTVFWISTAVLIGSSITIQAALRSFKQRAMASFRTLFLITLLLGIAFVVLQWIGFNWLWERGVRFEGSSGAGQFLYIIFGLHAIHVLGGMVALIVLFLRQYFGSTRTYNSTPIEIMSTYWHFVDVLWIYLLVFFIWIG